MASQKRVDISFENSCEASKIGVAKCCPNKMVIKILVSLDYDRSRKTLEGTVRQKTAVIQKWNLILRAARHH